MQKSTLVLDVAPLGVVLLGLLLGGCSWSRFDDVTEKAPVVMLKKPGAMSAGFGDNLTTITTEDGAILLVGGAAGVSSASTFDLGTSDSPGINATVTEYCNGETGSCFLSDSPAALPLITLDGQMQGPCFAEGLGATPVQDYNGLAIRCLDGLLHTLPIPKPYQDDLDFYVDSLQPDVAALSADRSEAPALLAGVASKPIAFFYPSGSEEPVTLLPPGKAPDSYGRVVNAFMADGKRVFAVSAPDEGQVFLFRETSDSADFIGCLGGTPNFGRKMASGPVLGDDQDDLVVSDSLNVHVFDGVKLAKLPVATAAVCTLGALPADTLIDSFSCGSSANISGCAGSNFGSALAVGDLDGDGDGEVVVGAPGMGVRDKGNAGAVLIFDIEEPGDTHFAPPLFISSAEGNDRLGASIALPNLGTHQIVAAGAPGSGKVALFYCGSMVPAALRGSRCE